MIFLFYFLVLISFLFLFMDFSFQLLSVHLPPFSLSFACFVLFPFVLNLHCVQVSLNFPSYFVFLLYNCIYFLASKCTNFQKLVHPLPSEIGVRPFSNPKLENLSRDRVKTIRFCNSESFIQIVFSRSGQVVAQMRGRKKRKKKDAGQKRCR